MTKSYHPSKEKRGKNLILDLLGYYDIKEVITDIAHGEVDLDTLKAGASLIPAGKVIKLPKVIKAIGNVGKTGFKKGREGDKTVWKRFTREDQPKPDKNKGNQSKAGSKSGTTTSKPNQEEALKSGQAKQTKAKNKEGSRTVKPEAAVTGSKKHGVEWKEGPARAKATGNSQGQWAKSDLDYATQMANTLQPGDSGYFDLPEGSQSIVHMPDGTTQQATRMWIRNNGTGMWHGYPMP